VATGTGNISITMSNYYYYYYYYYYLFFYPQSPGSFCRQAR